MRSRQGVGPLCAAGLPKACELDPLRAPPPLNVDQGRLRQSETCAGRRFKSDTAHNRQRSLSGEIGVRSRNSVNPGGTLYAIARRNTSSLAAYRYMAWLAPQKSRGVLNQMVSRTGWRSNFERLITFNTSLVAVCCSSASVSSRFAPVVPRRGHILDRDHRLVGKGLNQFDLPVSERLDNVAPNCDCSDSCSFSQ